MKAREGHHSNGAGMLKPKTGEEWRLFEVFDFVGKDQDEGDKINQVFVLFVNLLNI